MNPQNLNTFSDADLLSLVVGFLLPPLIAIIQQPRWPDWFRAVVTFAVCIAVGAAEAYLQGHLGAGSILRRILLVAVSANATYQGFWKHAGAKAIEAATSVSGISAIIDGIKARAEENRLIADQEAQIRAETLRLVRERLSKKTPTTKERTDEQ